jgi:hypothetical protein
MPNLSEDTIERTNYLELLYNKSMIDGLLSMFQAGIDHLNYFMPYPPKIKKLEIRLAKLNQSKTKKMFLALGNCRSMIYKGYQIKKIDLAIISRDGSYTYFSNILYDDLMQLLTNLYMAKNTKNEVDRILYMSRVHALFNDLELYNTKFNRKDDIADHLLKEPTQALKFEFTFNDNGPTLDNIVDSLNIFLSNLDLFLTVDDILEFESLLSGEQDLENNLSLNERVANSTINNRNFLEQDQEETEIEEYLETLNRLEQNTREIDDRARIRNQRGNLNNARNPIPNSNFNSINGNVQPSTSKGSGRQKSNIRSAYLSPFTDLYAAIDESRSTCDRIKRKMATLPYQFRYNHKD